MRFHANGATDIGRVRQNNEDAFLLEAGAGVFAVADGVGGMQAGELASKVAIAAVAGALANRCAEALGDLPGLVQEAHRAVRRTGDELPPGGIGTTLTLAHLADGLVRIAHVGDSYALLVRAGRCEAITAPHNVGTERRDILADAPHPPVSPHALTRVLGQPEPLQATLYEERLVSGDWLVLATDGLTDCVTLATIAATCTHAADPETAVRQLIEQALARGGRDNITVVAIRIEDA